METIFKTFRAELKEPDEDGSLNMFIPVSTASMDRDGEVIEPSAFKKTIPKFMKHPVLVASHDYRDLTNQIGEWTKLKITEEGIEGKPKYYIGMDNPQADWAYKLAQKGVAAFSIGFIPKEWVDGVGVKEPRRTYKEVELLEISQVIVPSNREAIQSIRSKGVDAITDKLYDDVDKVLEELVTKPEETDDFIRIPVDRGNHEGHRIRTIEISAKEGISALYCGTDKVIMMYLFRKDKGWDMVKARAWVKEHSKSVNLVFSMDNMDDPISGMVFETKVGLPVEDNKKHSQEEIIDEIDYLMIMIDKEGLSDNAKESFKELTKRLPGADIPVEDKPKEIVTVETKEPLTNTDILEAIKRIASK